MSIKLEDVPDINPEEFTFDKYICRVGYGLFEVLNPELHVIQPSFKVIGKCKATKLPIRPRAHPDEYGLMLFDIRDDAEVWFHYRCYE